MASDVDISGEGPQGEIHFVVGLDAVFTSFKLTYKTSKKKDLYEHSYDPLVNSFYDCLYQGIKIRVNLPCLITFMIVNLNKYI